MLKTPKTQRQDDQDMQQELTQVKLRDDMNLLGIEIADIQDHTV